jgi:hypothetical protein
MLSTTGFCSPSSRALLGAPAIGVGHEMLRTRISAVSERHSPGNPQPTSFQTGTGLSDSRSDHFALELGVGRKYVQQEAIVGVMPKLLSSDNSQADPNFRNSSSRVAQPSMLRESRPNRWITT